MKCLHLLRYCPERVFFITTSTNRDLIRDAHDCPAVEAVFLCKSDVQIDPIKHPKFVGNYIHSEELIASLRNAQEWFEQARFDSILFEDEQLFLWCQTWREVYFHSQSKTNMIHLFSCSFSNLPILVIHQPGRN